MEGLLSFPFPRITRRRRNILLACCAIGAGGYVSYRVYTSPSVTRKRLQLYRFFQSLSSLLDTAAQGSDCVGVLWKDLHCFLLSNQDEVPQSLKQLFKVGQTPEFQTSVALLCKSVTQGVASSLSGQSPLLQDDEGSTSFEELSSQRGARRIGKSGTELGYRESADGRYSRKERTRRSSGETDASQLKDVGEDGYRRGKLERSASTSRIEGEERDPDEAGEYFAWSRSWACGQIAETSTNGGRGNSRSPIKRRGSVEGREEGLSERLVGKIFSESGRGFASLVVASATRSLVLSVLEGIRDNPLGKTNWSCAVGLEGEGSNVPQSRETEKSGVSEGTPSKKPTSSSASGSFEDGIISFVCSSKGKSLIADCIETFIGTAVSVYLDKTRDVNVYDEILTTVSNPIHKESVRELLTSVCNGALETLIRACHEVLSVGSSSSAPPPENETESSQFGVESRREVRRLSFSLGKGSSFNQLAYSDVGESSECGQCDGGNEPAVPGSPPPWTPDSHDSESLSLSGPRTTRISFDRSPQSAKKIPPNDLDKAEAPSLSTQSYPQINGKPFICSPKSTETSQGWIEGVSRTLAVPSNRALVLDVAGTVTAEAVRSTIDVMLSKASLTLRGGKAEQGSALERSPGPSKVLRVMNKTGELAQATASKALVAMTMCLAICLHTLLGQSTVLEHT